MNPEATVFRPSMTVNLRLRFDETLQVAPSQVALAQASAAEDLGTAANTAQRPTGPRRPRIRLGTTVVESATGTSTVDAEPINRAWQGLEPLVTPQDEMTVLMNRIPIRGAVNLPGPRQAAEFDFEFDYRDLPIDPRLLRAVGVEVHLGCISDDDYARGMVGERDADGRLLSNLRTRSDLLDPFTGRPDVELQTLVFYGSADAWRVTHGSGGSRVRMTGRDLRGIFLDTKVPVATVRKVDLNQPIDQVVSDILATLPSKFDLVLDVFTDREEWPRGKVPSPVDAKGLTRLNLDEAGSGEAKAPGSGGAGKLNYWDLITQYCNLVGGIPYFRGTALWIRPARSIYQTLTDRRLPTPFAGGRPRFGGVVLGDDGVARPDGEIRVRRLVHGQHMESLEMERKFGGVVVPAIECVSIDDTKRGTQALLVARWPPADSVAGALKEDGDVLRIPVPGVIDKDRLLAVAHDIYEEIGRGEVTGTFETKYLTSFGGSSQDPDLLSLRPTDPLEITIALEALSSQSPIITELVRHKSRTFAEEVAELTAQLGDPVLARVLVAQTRRAIVGQLDVFRVCAVRFDWSDGRVGISGDFQTYVVARHRAEKEANAGAGKQRKVTRRRVKVKGQAGPVAISQTRDLPVGPAPIAAGAIQVRDRTNQLGGRVFGNSLGPVIEASGAESETFKAIRRMRGEDDLLRALERRGISTEGAGAGPDTGGDD